MLRRLFLILAALLFLSTSSVGCGAPGLGSQEAEDERTWLIYQLQQRAVRIMVDCPDGSSGWGSSVILDNHTIATAWHVVDNPACSLTVKPYGRKPVPAGVVNANPEQDVAILMTPADLGISTELNLNPYRGQHVWCLGWPMDHLVDDGVFTITDGLISGVSLDADGQDLLRTTTPIYFGNSGGSCFDDQGRVVGLADMLVAPAFGIPLDGQYYLVPARQIQELL